MYPPKKD